MFLKTRKYVFFPQFDQPTFPLQARDRFPVDKSRIVNPHDIPLVYSVSVSNRMELSKGFSQVIEGIFDFFLLHFPDALLNDEPFVVHHSEIGSNFHSRGITKGLSLDKLFRDNLRS